MKIYVIIGITGEYSDRTEWLVAAYKDKARAEAHCDEAQKWANTPKKNRVMPNKWDKYFSEDRGTIYCVSELELRKELP